jgi:hypothetical protein
MTKSNEAKYIEAAVLHLKFLEEGDPKKSNESHDRLISAIREIRKRKDRGRSFLLDNLTSSYENVRLWCAFHLLPIEPELALSEIDRLAARAKSSVVGFNAEVTANEWRKGTLDVDWFVGE